METSTGHQSSRLGTLARHVVGIDSARVQPSVIDSAKACVLDLLGCMLGGAGAETLRRVVSLVRKQGGAGEATAVGCQVRLPVEQAAFANATSAHVLELDDIHRLAAGLHPGAVIIPAALAVSELTNASGRDFISSVLAGYDVAGRVATAINLSHRQRGFFSTGTVGPLGAAAAASRLLRLDVRQTIAALSLAASQGAGFFEFLADGSPVKAVQAGWAARNGVHAALLAREGLYGPETALEGREGFARAFADDYQSEVITAELGYRFEVENSCFKLYATCGHAFPAIDAALAIRAELVGKNSEYRSLVSGAWDKPGDSLPSAIKRITVKTYRAAAVLDKRDPSTETEAKFSIPYCVAAALILGQISLDAFSTETRALKSLREVTLLVEVTESPDITRSFPDRRTAVVTVDLKDGSRLCNSVDYPRGTPENPISLQELEGKFWRTAGMQLPPSKCEAILRQVNAINMLQSVAPVISSFSTNS